MCLFGPGQVAPIWPAQKTKSQELLFILVLFREGSGISVA